MRRIYEYSISVGMTFSMGMLPGPVVLVAEQGGEVTLWIEHDECQPEIMRRFIVFGTGHPIDDELTHVGSCTVDYYVWHVYEYPEA